MSTTVATVPSETKDLTNGLEFVRFIEGKLVVSVSVLILEINESMQLCQTKSEKLKKNEQ